jgi:PASTA domain
MVQVPRLVGKPFDQAVQLLNQSHHGANQTFPRIVSESEPVNLEQHPTPGQMVDPGATVNFSLVLNVYVRRAVIVKSGGAEAYKMTALLRNLNGEQGH